MCMVSVGQLIAWYRFSEVVSNIQYDMSGNNNHGQISNNPATLGPHGLFFNGSTDYLDLPSNTITPTSMDLNPPFTYTVWFMRDRYNLGIWGALFQLNSADKVLLFRFYIDTEESKYPQLTIETSEGSKDAKNMAALIFYSNL